MGDIDLISAWEVARGQPPVWRGVTILAAHGAEAPQLFGVGAREAGVLAVYRELIGERLDCEAHCDTCGERLEFSLTPQDLAAPSGAASPRVDVDGWTVTVRVPTTEDVAWAIDQPDPNAALFRRCVVAAARNGVEPPTGCLPAFVRDACERRLDELAPLANVDVELACPACGQAGRAPLDISAFVLTALHQWVATRLNEVARLCHAYGWAETDVLTMSRWRRRFYLAQLGEL